MASKPNVGNHNTKTKSNYWYSTISSDFGTFTMSSNHNSRISAALRFLKTCWCQRQKEVLPVLKTNIRSYTLSANYRKYWLAIRSFCCNETLSSSLSKRVRKIKLRLNLLFVDSNNPISIVCFLTTLKLECDGNPVQDGAAIWFLPYFVKDTLFTTLNSRTSVATITFRIVPSRSTLEPVV